MDLHQYFSNHKGTGILSTADSDGRVGTAVYARPLVMEDGRLAMIMRERLAYRNLQQNPHAAYLFLEDSPGHQGIRLYLEKDAENDNSELIQKMTRRHLSAEEDAAKGPKHMVYFRVNKILQLIGGEEL